MCFRIGSIARGVVFEESRGKEWSACPTLACEHQKRGSLGRGAVMNDLLLVYERLIQCPCWRFPLDSSGVSSPGRTGMVNEHY